MFKSQEIAELQAKITTLSADLATTTTCRAALQAELDQAKADLATAQNQATAHAATITDLQTRLTAAEAAKTAAEQKATAAEASINQQVTDRLAAAGVAPVAKDPQAKNPEEPGAKAEGSPLKRAAAAMSSFRVFGN